MKHSHALDPEHLIDFQQEGYRIRALPPFKRFRGLDIPWDDPEALNVMSERIAKSSRSRKVVLLAAGQFGLPVEVYVKRYNFKSWVKYLLRTGRKTRAREEFDLGWRLLRHGIKTPRPVWLAESRGPLSRFSMLATEALPAAESARERWQRCGSDGQRMALLAALGQFTGRMHDLGFYHDDYKAGHLLLLPTRPSNADEFYLIDLQGCGFYLGLTKLRRARNLYQLLHSFAPSRGSEGFGPEHRMEFLRSYCGSRVEAESWSAWVNRVRRIKRFRV